MGVALEMRADRKEETLVTCPRPGVLTLLACLFHLQNVIDLLLACPMAVACFAWLRGWAFSVWRRLWRRGSSGAQGMT